MTMKLRVQDEPAIYKVLLEQAAANWPWPLPPEWQWHRIGEVTQVVGGGTPRTTEVENFGGEIPWITPADLSGYFAKHISRGARNISASGLASSGARLMPQGTVLFSSRAPIGYVAIASNPVATNQGFKSFVLGPNLLSDFVYYWLKVAKPMAVALASGTTFLEVSGKKIAQLPIPVAPLAVQRAVVAYLDEQLSRLDASVAALHRVQANLKRYRASVLKSACEGRLVPTEAELARQESRDFETGAQLLQRILAERRARLPLKGKYKDPSEQSAVVPHDLPDGWAWASLDQLMSHITDGDHQAPPQTSDGVPFLVIGNVRTGRIDLEGSRFVSRGYFDSLDPHRIPAFGDLLYTLVGSYGIAVSVDIDSPFCIQRHMAILRPHALTPMRFLALTLNADSVFKQATAIATGTAQLTVPLLGLRRIVIALPPLAEQHRIVAEADRRLSLIRVAEAQIAANLARAQRLRQSILQAAFAAPVATT